MSRVLVTPRSLTAGGLDAVPELEPLREAGFELVSGPPGRVPTEAELLGLVPGCTGWLAGVEAVTARVLDAGSRLRVISRNGAGTDAIDLAAARRAGVRVERAPGANAQGVAELTLALALAALRHVPWSAVALRAGAWERHLGRELADCTVGVVGLGAVGARVAGAFAVLGADVHGYDPAVPPPPGVRAAGLADVLAGSDVVTLHRPPAPDGRPVVTAATLEAARPGAVLVNTARAALVDDDAVLAALRSGRLSAYAVDAHDSEPPARSALLQHERVVATPHVGGYTGASMRRATTEAVAHLLAALAVPA